MPTPIQFPEFPYDGQEHAHEGRTWVFEEAVPAWKPASGLTILDPAIIARRSNEGFAVTVGTEQKEFDATDASIDDLVNVLATLIQTLKNKQII